MLQYVLSLGSNNIHLNEVRGVVLLRNEDGGSNIMVDDYTKWKFTTISGALRLSPKSLQALSEKFT